MARAYQDHSEPLPCVGFLHASGTTHGHLDSTRVLLDHNLIAKITGLSCAGFSSTVSNISSLSRIILQLLTGNELIDVQNFRLVLESSTLECILDQTAGNWPPEIATQFAGIGLQCSENIKSCEEMMEEINDMLAKATLLQATHRGNKCTQLNPPNIFLCPILQEVMKEPHMAADGFSYELEAIKEWLSTGHGTSPMTNLKLKNKHLIPNHNLQYLIRDWHEKNSKQKDFTRLFYFLLTHVMAFNFSFIDFIYTM